jgi:putative ABC transport system permease protein
VKLHHVVFKDIVRRKKRVLYAALGVIIATMTVVGVLTIAMAGRARIYTQLEKYGANLSIVPATKNLDTGLGDLTLGSVTVGNNYIPETALVDIRRIADGEIRKALKNVAPEGDIATLAPQLLLQSEVKGTGVILAGILPKEEAKIKTWWQIGTGKYMDAPGQAMAGATAAALLKLSVGDVIPLNGSQVTLVGILSETGSGDDYRIFVPLDTLQAAFGKEGLLTTIDVRALCNACPVEVIADAINKEVPGLRAVAVKQVAATEMGMLDKINKLMMALGGVTLVVGGFGVVNTLMTSVHERVRDIGIMKAVGASRRQIITAFVYEAIVIGIIGGILGYVAGTLLAYVLGPVIFEGTSITLVWMYIPLSLGLAIAIAVGATLYPAYHATKIKIADCFRAL